MINIFYLFAAINITYRYLVARAKNCRRPWLWVAIGKKYRGKVKGIKTEREGEDHMVSAVRWLSTSGAGWPCALQIKGRHRLQGAHRVGKELLISCRSEPLLISKVALQTTRLREITPPRIPSGPATCSASECGTGEG